MTIKELSDLLDTKESELYVCDKPYHKNTKKRQKGRGEVKHLLNGALPKTCFSYLLFPFLNLGQYM